MLKAELFLTYLTAGGIKILYCFFILILCSIAIKISETGISKVFSSKITQSRHIDSKKASTLASVTSSVARYAIMFVGLCSVLINFGVPSSTLTAVLGTGTVAIGLGAQNIIKDIISGFFILLENQFGVGDLITVEGKTGTVEDISIRTTQIRDANGTLHIIPNGGITIVSNMCKDFINAIVDVDVAYAEDLEHVLAVLNDEMDNAFATIPNLREKPVVLGVANLGESSIKIRILAECQVKENYSVERALRLCIKNRFGKENISIPFPQCTVHIAQK